MCQVDGRYKNDRRHEAARFKEVETVVDEDVDSSDSEYATSNEDFDNDNNVSCNEWNDGCVRPLHSEHAVTTEAAVEGPFRGYTDTSTRVGERRIQYVPLDDEVGLRMRGNITREDVASRMIHHVVDVTTTTLQ